MPVNSRRQTLAAGVHGSNEPPSMPPSSKPSGGGSSRPRVPKSRKSMIPRCAGSTPTKGDAHNANNVNRENNGRAPSGIVAPSPPRHGGGGGRSSRAPSASRKSLGGAILQTGFHASTPRGKSPAKNRRVSMAPTAAAAAAGGHSSSNSNNNAASIDPRDIKDKSYLQNAIRKMVSYLKLHGYRDASNLPVKQLVNNGPSGRDFQNIMTFLMRRVDPTFHMPPPNPAGGGGRNNSSRSDEIQLKFEDEVSMAFKCLGYPFPISKTGLVAVGSPHTWPALIAAIDWLVDVLAIRDDEELLDWGPDEYDVNDDELSTLAGSSQKVHTQIHKFLRKSMVAFLADRNDECEELEGDLMDEFQRDSEGLHDQITELDEECGRMREEVEMLNEEVNGLSEAQQKQEEYATNIEKFLNLIQTVTDHKAEFTRKVDTLAEEKSKTENEMERNSRKIEQLKQTIGSQELSQEDVRRMEREKSRIEDQISKQQGVLVGHVAALREAHERWLAVYELLEQKVQEYNAKATNLELIPKTAKHAKGNDFEAKLQQDQAAEGITNLLGGLDIAGGVKPHVEKLVRGYESGMTSEKNKHVEIKCQIESVEGESEQVVEDIEATKDKISSCEEETEATKEKLESDIKAKQRQLDLLQTKISSLNDPEGVKATIAKYDAEHKRLQLQLEKERKEHAAMKKAVDDEIRAALMKAKEYQDYKKKKLHEMNSHIKKRKEEAEQLKLLDS